MDRVTGLGGIFIKTNDPKFLSRWYEDHFGMNFGTQVYASFPWREWSDSEVFGRTEFCFFRDDSDYFKPSSKDLMLNFRVKNLDQFLSVLKNEGVTVLEPRESYEYGKFGWILDPEGNKIELWEPVVSGSGEPTQTVPAKGPVTGIGGIFLKSSDPGSLVKWYSDHLGLDFADGAHLFRWHPADAPAQTGLTVFSFFEDKTDYFQPSEKTFMLNLRVKNLDDALKELRSAHVDVLEKTARYDFGSFGWCMDPSGTKIELWEPVEEKP